MKIEYNAADAEVVVRIPCDANLIAAAPISKTGKSKMVATTQGFVKIDGAPDGVKLSLNLIGPK